MKPYDDVDDEFPEDDAFPEGDAADDGDDEGPEAPSKSQIKREDQALQALGKRMTGLSAKQIAEFPVEESLKDALLEWKRIRSHEAQRRHIKRIGKLVREHDVEELELAMDRADPSSSLSMSATRMAQDWCDRLLRDGKPAMTLFVERYQVRDIQLLRQLQRAALPDAAAESPTPAVRKLMRFVRQQVVQKTA